MNNQQIKAVAYARVSSEEQKKEGFSIPAQLDLLNDFALKNNIEVVPVGTSLRKCFNF